MPRSAALLAALVLLVFAAPLAAQKHRDVEKIGERDINKGSWNIYSLEREIAIGRQMAAELESSARLLRDPLVQEYVDDLVQNIVRHSDARAPFTVQVIDSDELNAIALPGGFLYVNTGLILEAKTEAELAGILAHEVAHITARHSTKQATKATILNWVTLPLIFIGGPVALGARQALSLMVPMTFLKFKRNAEREADFLGLQYSYQAGYDPVALVDFLERLKEQQKAKESRLAAVFSTHPMTRDRIQRAQKEIGQVLPPRWEYVVTSARFDSIKAYLLQLQQATLEQAESTSAPRLRRRTQDAEEKPE